VPDQIPLLVAQDRALGSPQPAQLEGHDPAEQKGQDRDGAGAHRDDSRRAGQVVHWRQHTITWGRTGT
jgi:hypothetical protein